VTQSIVNDLVFGMLFLLPITRSGMGTRRKGWGGMCGGEKKIKEENTQPAGIREGGFSHTRTYAPTHPHSPG